MRHCLWILFLVTFTVHGNFAEDRVLWDKDQQHPKFLQDLPSKRIKANWYELDRKRIEDAKTQAEKIMQLHKPAKNVVFIMGDGMGVTTSSTTRLYLAQTRNVKDDQLSWEKMPHSAFSKTYSANKITTDSAASGTAMLTGQKTINDVVGVNEESILDNCSSTKGKEIKSILHHSTDEGKWTGIVTTTRITHASPASTYAHSAERDWECDADLTPEAVENGCADIAAQLIDNNKDIRVILGGGRENMIPNDVPDDEYPDLYGKRTDGRNLIKEWQETKAKDGILESEYKYVYNLDEFNAVDENTIQYLMGLFELDHMRYHLDSVEDPGTLSEPTLSQMVEKAIKILRRSSEGYFLFVEGGRIDHAHHKNLPKHALSEAVELSDAVQKVLDLTSEDDTLVVVTADHSHVLTMGGYLDTDANILGLDERMVAEDNKPYTQLAYSNGPGYWFHRYDKGSRTEIPRKDLTEMKQQIVEDRYFVWDAGIPRDDESHGGEDVAIFARGPMAHLFHGVQEQSYIGNLMMYASCVGRNKDLCQNKPVGPCTAVKAQSAFTSNGTQSYFTVLAFIVTVSLCSVKIMQSIYLNCKRRHYSSI